MIQSRDTPVEKVGMRQGISPSSEESIKVLIGLVQ